MHVSRHSARRGRAGEAGQVIPLVAAAIGVMAIAVLVVALVGQRAVARAQARTAADAAALAAAVGGVAVGSAIAAQNGAEVLELSVDEEAGTAYASVVVAAGRAGDLTAQARAEAVILPGADGLAPAMVAAIARAQAMLGTDIPIASGFRTREQQQALWDNRHSNPFPVAVPGTSRHELGLAIDVPSSFVATLLTVAADAGLCQPLPVTDRVHFILC